MPTKGCRNGTKIGMFWSDFVFEIILVIQKWKEGVRLESAFYENTFYEELLYLETDYMDGWNCFY